MRKFIVVNFCICILVGLALGERSEEDYSRFEDPKLLEVMRKFNDYNDEAVPPNGLETNHVIDPPPRCKPCYKLDFTGRCRKIVDCEV